MADGTQGWEQAPEVLTELALLLGTDATTPFIQDSARKKNTPATAGEPIDEGTRISRCYRV